MKKTYEWKKKGFIFFLLKAPANFFILARWVFISSCMLAKIQNLWRLPCSVLKVVEFRSVTFESELSLNENISFLQDSLLVIEVENVVD